ncbi:MAG: hypothetical protein WCL23_00575 [Candidatus Moraniibacteriota bacterium]
MKRNFRSIVSVGVVAVLVGVSLAGVASAKSSVVHGKSTEAHGNSVAAQAKNVTRVKGNQKTHNRTIPGKIASLGSNSFTMAKGNKVYSISTSSASFVNNHGVAITFADLKVGDKVNVKGTVTGTSVVATTVRDITQNVKKVITTSTSTGL